MKRTLVFALVLLSTKLIFAQSGDSTHLSKVALITIFEKYQKAQDNVFKSGSIVADVDTLYAFYTDDFEYNHPKYGGIYTRAHLYNNTVKFLKAGRYNGGKKRNTLNRIVGLDAIVIEQQYEGKSETTMTLFKFRKDKIYYIEEYW
jgi:hypothetical protein